MAAAEAAKTAQRVAQTRARDLQHRVERMEAIRGELDPHAKPLPPAAVDVACGIADAPRTGRRDRRRRSRDARRGTVAPDPAHARRGTPQAGGRGRRPEAAAAARDVRAEDRAPRAPRARHRRGAARAAGRAARGPARDGRGLRLGARRAAAPSASRSTGQTHVADGIPRSRAEQLLSMVRLGGPQGRVGVVGTEAGRSVNREQSRASPAAAHATENDFGRDSDRASRRRAVVLEGPREQAGRDGGIGDHGRARPGRAAAASRRGAGRAGLSAVRIPGSSLDLTGNAEDGRHEFVRYAAPPAVDVATLHTAAGSRVRRRRHLRRARLPGHLVRDRAVRRQGRRVAAARLSARGRRRPRRRLSRPGRPHADLAVHQPGLLPVHPARPARRRRLLRVHRAARGRRRATSGWPSPPTTTR